MKKISKILFLFLAVSLFAVADSNAQVIVGVGIHVGVRPHRPHGYRVVRGPRPSLRHIWVGEEWAPSGNTYVYVAPHWAAPPRDGYHWVPGHWAHDGYGDQWIAGRWAPDRY